MLFLIPLLTLVPQGEGQLAGRVLDAAGKPAAGATVTLLHRPIERLLDPAHEHRIVVTTDERGAFRAQPHEGATYSAWAATADAASSLCEGVDGGFVELRIAPGTGARHVMVTGLDAWPDAATLRFRALVGGEHLDFVDAPLRDGALRLPPLPPLAIRTIEALIGERLLWAATPEPGDPDAQWQLPPPATHTLVVHDAGGQPLAGVEVLAHIVNYWATESEGVPYGSRFAALWPSQGSTDVAGRLTLRVPSPTNGPARLWLLARKDGLRSSLDGLHDGKRIVNGRTAAPPPDATDHTIHITLEKAAPQALAVAAADGTPCATQALLLVARVHVQLDGGGGMGMPLHVLAPIVDGRATLASPLPAGSDVELAWTTLAAPLRDVLRKQHGFAPPLAFRLPAPAQLLQPGPAAQVDATRWRELRIVAADGRPAGGVVVQLRPTTTRWRPHEEGRLVRTDRRGRVLVELRGPHRASVFARDGIGGLDLPADADGPFVMTLQPVHAMLAAVVDDSGRGIDGATASLRMATEAHAGFLVGEHHLLSYLLRPRQEGNGRFVLVLPPFPAHLEIEGDAPGHRHGKLAVEWDPGAVAPIELRLDRR